ncbi:hypothetical protein MKA57_03395 [[Clostridium] innocuum]|nr:hypothetical protein [[Clostridium] innocuum]MCR0363485.1 hypothetical protein [[Clostridium] innocuum]MCR0549245.1 hypothetical protein [[Clostridium] innocuum]MCR0604790.1 hypothetical protein [[Clostridium] innocuum]
MRRRLHDGRDLPVSRLTSCEPILGGIIRHRSSGTWVTFKTPQERFCGVVFSHGAANRDGGKAGREGGRGDGYGKGGVADMAVGSHG